MAQQVCYSAYGVELNDFVHNLIALFRSITPQTPALQPHSKQAKGYRNTDNFFTIIYFVLGKLNLELPT